MAGNGCFEGIYLKKATIRTCLFNQGICTIGNPHGCQGLAAGRTSADVKYVMKGKTAVQGIFSFFFEIRAVILRIRKCHGLRHAPPTTAAPADSSKLTTHHMPCPVNYEREFNTVYC